MNNPIPSESLTFGQLTGIMLVFVVIFLSSTVFFLSGYASAKKPKIAIKPWLLAAIFIVTTVLSYGITQMCSPADLSYGYTAGGVTASSLSAALGFGKWYGDIQT